MVREPEARKAKPEPCYRDYVIVDGQLVGRFEEMYRDVRDPWGCTAQAGDLHNRVLLELLRGIAAPKRFLDVGCGLGALTRRVVQLVRPAEMYACDISGTAVARAREEAPQIDFFTHDLLREPRLPFEDGSVDLILMSEVAWHILSALEKVLRDFERLLSIGGILAVKQAFFRPGVQQYGAEVLSCPGDLRRYLEQAGLAIERQASVEEVDGACAWMCRAARGLRRLEAG